jgi:hypothetical protein
VADARQAVEALDDQRPSRRCYGGSRRASSPWGSKTGDDSSRSASPREATFAGASPSELAGGGLERAVELVPHGPVRHGPRGT